MKLQCIIVDDEQLARDMLEAYLKKMPEITVAGKCKSVAEAHQLLKYKKIDLLLLDIQMPRQTGLEFLRNLPNPPKVILTTAFKEYAIEGFELKVVDYLLKPIGFERFQEAILKVKEVSSLEFKAKAFENSQVFEQQFIMAKVGYHHHKVFLTKILYIKAMREYVCYFTNQGKIMELKSLSLVEQALPKEHFIRIHRSYIVAKSAIIKHEQNTLVLSDNTILPLGKTFKQQVLQQLF